MISLPNGNSFISGGYIFLIIQRAITPRTTPIGMDIFIHSRYVMVKWAFFSMKLMVMMFDGVPDGVHRPPMTAPNVMTNIMQMPKLLFPGFAPADFATLSPIGYIRATTATSVMKWQNDTQKKMLRMRFMFVPD